MDHSAHMHAAGAHTANVGDGMDMYMMISWFHFNMQDVVLFENWVPNSGGKFFGTLVFITVLCLVKEAIFGYRRALLIKFRNGIKPEEANMEALMSGRATKTNKASRLKVKLVDCLGYMLHLLFGYTVMLIVMTFNVSFFITIILASGAGHFLFSSDLELDPKAATDEPGAECCESSS